MLRVPALMQHLSGWLTVAERQAGAGDEQAAAQSGSDGQEYPSVGQMGGAGSGRVQGCMDHRLAT